MNLIHKKYLIAAGFLVIAPTLFAAPPALQKYVTDSGTVEEALPQVLVKYKPGRAEAMRNGFMKQMKAKTVRRLDQLGYELVNVPDGQTLQSFLNQLKNNPDVERVGPNGILRANVFPTTDPNDPDFSTQYSLDATRSDVRETWKITTGSSTIVVAVIDTGITLDHPDLDGSLWTNPTPSGNSGLRGTSIEIDWLGDGCDPSVFVNGAGHDQCAGPDPTDDNIIRISPTTGGPISDLEYHGTRVSGIIAAEVDNSTGIAGVCPNCKIMAVKALNDAGNGTYGAVAEAITYAVNNGASIINMSLGGGADPSGAVATAVNLAIGQNVVVVAASGNEGNSFPVSFPASIPAIIAVGATDSSNALAYFSQTGNNLDLVAPGVGIISTTNSPFHGTDAAGGDGTSFSSPIVAGVAGLIRSLFPAMSVADVTTYISFTATDLGIQGYDGAYGFGLLNARRAVLSAQSGTILTSPASPGESFPYPNPVHPNRGETVTFALPTSMGTSGLEIKIFTIAGEKVKTLTGTQLWDGKNDDGNLVATGLYFYFAKTSNGDVKGKVSVIK